MAAYTRVFPNFGTLKLRELHNHAVSFTLLAIHVAEIDLSILAHCSQISSLFENGTDKNIHRVANILSPA